MNLGNNAVKVLKCFQDKNLKEAEYVWPPEMEVLFEDDFEVCEMHKRKLARAGLVELGSPRLSTQISSVRPAALTQYGVRYLSH
jgi:hypothetical protein